MCFTLHAQSHDSPTLMSFIRYRGDDHGHDAPEWKQALYPFGQQLQFPGAS